MASKEKILELLSKEDLTENEVKFLNEKFDQHPDLKIYRSIFDLLKDISSNSHLESDLIAEYILHKNNKQLEVNSIIKIIPKIEKHISGCAKCRSEFELFNNEFSEVDNYINEKIAGNKKHDSKAVEAISVGAIFNNSFTKYSFASVFAMILLYMSLFTVSEITTPSYKKMSSLYEMESFSSNRGRISTQFQKGLEAIKENNFENAAVMLEEDIKKNVNDETLFYTHYTLGLVYLQKSEHDVLGLFNSFDKSDLNKAVFNFEESIRKNKTGSFRNITYDAYYYLGRTYLVNDDFNNASRYLNLVIENKGRFYKDAEELLSSLQ